MSKLDYEAAGVSISTANETKREFGSIVSAAESANCKPLNRVGAFASLIDIDLKRCNDPVFVMKSEEPGSKQLLSVKYDRIPWLARDLINHLVNDIVVMGAEPCAVLDTIICGDFRREVILGLVREISAACAENSCVLVGGETSEQPGTLPDDRYVLQASILGVVDRSKIVDGSKIKAGDKLIALASNGLHTNGYSLVRRLIENSSGILDERVGQLSFMDAILQPHTAYYPAIKRILERVGEGVHGMAHITGGGIHDNLIRIIQDDRLKADIDLSSIRIPEVFKIIRKYSQISDADMLWTFNTGVGMIIVAEADAVDTVCEAARGCGNYAYTIGDMRYSDRKRDVYFTGSLNWE